MYSSVKGRKKAKEDLRSQHEYSGSGMIIPYITNNPNCLWCVPLAVHIGITS